LLSGLAALLAALYLSVARNFPWQLTAMSAMSVGALVFVSLNSIGRLRRQLSTPTFIVERDDESDQSRGASGDPSGGATS
jgi:hypothetical protein